MGWLVGVVEVNDKFNNFYSTYYWYKIEITSLGRKKTEIHQNKHEANPTAIKIVLANCVKIL